MALDLADHPHHAVAADDFAFLTARLDRSPNFHLLPRLPNLTEPVCNTTPRQVIGRKFHQDPIAGGNADVVDPHLA